MLSSVQMMEWLNWWNGTKNVNVAKSSNPVRFGVLGAAKFSPVGLFDPARSHPDALILAIGARSLKKAEAQAKQYGVLRAYGSYDEVLQQADIDAIYIPLPIAFHAEWAIRAMRAGKHVLIEKAITVNSTEAIQIRDCARETGKIALEAFHWQFHPSNHAVKALIESGKYGKIVSTVADLRIPQMFGEDDIRFQYSTGGGACLDLAYVFSSTRYFTGGNGTYKVLRATPRLNKKDRRVDEAIEIDIDFYPKGTQRTVKCAIKADLHTPKKWGFIPVTAVSFIIQLEKAEITVTNFLGPHLYHNITIKDAITGVKSTQKHYSFGPKWGVRSETWWSTYRYQLEAFVMRVKGEEPPHWIGLDESVEMMKLVDQVYEKAGMEKRGLPG